MIEKSPPAEVEVGTLTHNLFAAGPLIEGDHQLPKMTSSVISPFHGEPRIEQQDRRGRSGRLKQ
jgi:hypothetical protein